MDPKDINQLDPKLREAYDRVMGTDLSNQVPNSNPPAGGQIPTNEPVQGEPAAPQFGTQNVPPPPPSFDSSQAGPQTTPPPPPPIHLDTSQAPTEPTNPVNPTPVYQSFNSETPSQPQASEAVAVHHFSRLAISTPILMVLGIVFFIAYAALWVMVFGIKLF